MVWSSRKLERKPKPCGVYKEHSRRLQDIGTPQSAQNQHCERGEPSEGCNVVRFPTGVKPKGAIRWHCRARILAAHSACPQAERLIRRRRTYPKMSSFRSASRHDRELHSTEKPLYSNCCNRRLLFFERNPSPSPQPRAHAFTDANVDCATHDFDGPERPWLFTAELPACSDRRRNPCARPIPPVEGRLSRRSAARPCRQSRRWVDHPIEPSNVVIAWGSRWLEHGCPPPVTNDGTAPTSSATQ